jgi:SAM-dependent methyltransferase
VSELHPATRGFGTSVGLYERGRPGYPAAAVRRLVERLALGPGRTVLDLGAGTGKLTRLLVPTGATVLAVEPVDEMRDELERLVPQATALAGTAEHIPLDDASVDAVTAAQSFHWFAADAALAEIRRVLRPACGLALVWNTRDLRDPLQAAVSEIIEPFEGETPRRHHRDWAAVLDDSSLFERVEATRFRHRQKVDEEGLVGRVLSISFVAASPPAVRREIETRVRALARERGGELRLPYMTELYLAFARQR